jgi:CubicO group peptidase (beta-lactamase class C family)
MRRSAVARIGTLIGVVALVSLVWLLVREPDVARIPVRTLADLETELEALRQRLRIPGMSAAIAQRDTIVWARGFGMADVDRPRAATPDSIYHLASLTKPYASTVLLQLVESGRLNLDTPISEFGIMMERSAPVKVWHLLSHTSDDPPGANYRYDGNAFGRLTDVIERASGQPFAKVLSDRIIRPLGLTHTAPNPGDAHGFWSLVASLTLAPEDVARARTIFAASELDRASVEAGLVQGYARAWGRWLWPSGVFGPMRPMPHGFSLSATAGLVASATDVARFSIALDDGRLLSETSRQRAWTAPSGANGVPLPYALGWFVQQHNAGRLVWHYGQGLESSSLILKIPDDRITFVILANSDGLSRWRSLGDDANVAASPAAMLFLNWQSAQPRR